MTESYPVLIGGRIVGVTKPTDGQYEALVRIQHALSRGSEDSPAEFWKKQISRIGTLLDSLIVEADRETVDDMFLTGKIDTSELLHAIFTAFKEEKEKAGETNQVVAQTKANGARVRRK